MGLLRSLFTLCLLGLVIYIAVTVPIGSRTLWGHIHNIWQSDEAQELVEGVKETSAPVVDRVRKGVKAGLKDEDAGSRDSASDATL